MCVLQSDTNVGTGTLALFRDPRLRRCCRLLLRRRDREGEPDVPALRPVLGAEFLVALEVQIALKLGAERNDVADLRADAEHLRLEAADPVAGPAVAGELLVGVADEAELQLLGDELRGGPVEMHVDAVLVLRRLILQIVGKAQYGGEFMSRLRIEIGIAAAAVDRAVPDADIG